MYKRHLKNGYQTQPNTKVKPKTVQFFCDEFHKFNDTEIGITSNSAVATARLAIPQHLESSRTWLAKVCTKGKRNHQKILNCFTGGE